MFYGNLSLGSRPALQPNERTAYLFREQFTVFDTLLTLVFGVSLSLTRKTFVIEECPLSGPPPPHTTQPNLENPNFQKAVQSAVDAFLKQNEKEHEDVLVATISKNKKTYTSKTNCLRFGSRQAN